MTRGTFEYLFSETTRTQQASSPVHARSQIWCPLLAPFLATPPSHVASLRLDATSLNSQADLLRTVKTNQSKERCAVVCVNSFKKDTESK